MVGWGEEGRSPTVTELANRDDDSQAVRSGTPRTAMASISADLSEGSIDGAPAV